MKHAFARLALAAFSAALLCSCEKDETKDKWNDVKEKVGLEDKDNTAAGDWSGKSGADGENTVLALTEKDGAVTGTATWPASSLAGNVSGTRSGRNVLLYVGDDTWRLTLKSDKMWGSGESSKDGSTYNLSFVR